MPRPAPGSRFAGAPVGSLPGARPPRRLNRLALRIALPAACWLGIVPVLVFWAAGRPVPWLFLGVVLGVGFAAVYASAYHYLHRRIRLAYTTLRELGERRFDHLEATRVPPGDELSNLIGQVYRTGQALQEEIERLQQMESYRREFLGNVSHELKTPIFAVQGFAETLLDGALEDPSVNHTFVGKILYNAERLSHLTNDLAEISRIETGELRMTMEPFDLTDLVRDVVESLEVKAAQHTVTLHLRIPEELPMVRADRERIRQVLINLVDNGIKYGREGGYVEVSAYLLPHGTVRVAVVDDGLGIPAEHLPRLTERFYRVDRSRSRARGGTGLGLAIVKHILEAHGQKLAIESIAGLGSTFSFQLDAVEKPAPDQYRKV